MYLGPFIQLRLLIQWASNPKRSGLLDPFWDPISQFSIVTLQLRFETKTDHWPPDFSRGLSILNPNGSSSRGQRETRRRGLISISQIRDWSLLQQIEYTHLSFPCWSQKEALARLEEIKKSIEAKMALRQSNLNPERPGLFFFANLGFSYCVCQMLFECFKLSLLLI